MSRSNNVEVGFLKFTPSYGLLIKDGDDSQGEVQVEMYSQVELFGNVPMEDTRPHFILTKNSEIENINIYYLRCDPEAFCLLARRLIFSHQSRKDNAIDLHHLEKYFDD